MPIKISDAPGTLPKAAKKLYVGAFNGAYSGTCKKRSDRDACASMIAWGAVKNKYTKRGDKWVAKAQVLNGEYRAALVEVELIITKATLQADGSMRWQAVASDTDADRSGDSTSLQLFNDWIQRAESGKSEPWLPEPRMPFLGVSHYPSLDGLGEAGRTERMFIDGKRFKADGPFLDTLLGKALFAAIRDEREAVKKGEAVPLPAIRISAAWWDIQHSHNDFTFTRRSLIDLCPFCLRGAGDKMFLQGQLDHFASTRVPVHPRTSLDTSLELEEKSMVKRKDDAASIVGDDLAEELEKQAQELVGKSEAETEAALVVKAEEGGVQEQADVEKHFPEEAQQYRPYGGATSIQEAEEFIQAIRVEDQIWNNWDVFSCVAGNIMSSIDEDLDKLAAMRAAVDEFSGRVAAIKSSAVDAFLVRSTIGGITMQEDPKVEKVEVEPEVTNDPALAFKAAVDAALANPAAGREAMIGAVQTAIDGYVATVKAQIDAVIPPPPGEELAEVVKAMLQPLAERLDLLTAKLEQRATQAAAVPVQKSVVALPGSAPADLQRPPTVREVVRRSVGIQ